MLDPSKLKEFADDNFKFDENGRKLSKRVENTVGKGEITLYEQFLLSHSVFKRLVLQICKKQGLFRKGLTQFLGVLDGLLVKCRTCQLEAAGSTLTRSSFFFGSVCGQYDSEPSLGMSRGSFTLYHSIPTSFDPEERAFWKHYGKRRKYW